MAHNCKHAVAVLLEIQAREPAAPLPEGVAAWLRNLMYANIAEQSRPPAAARSSIHRVIFALMPDKFPLGTQLLLCKGKVGRDGGILSAASVTDFYQFSAYRPDYVTDSDQLLVQLLTAMRAEGEFGAARALPQALLGAELLRRLLDVGCLYWADSKAALKDVLAPMHAAPVVQGELTWPWRALRPDRRSRPGADLVCLAATRRGGLAHTAIPPGDPGPVAIDQEPSRQGGADGGVAERAPPAVPDRHAAAKPPRRIMVAVSFPHAGAAGR